MMKLLMGEGEDSFSKELFDQADDLEIEDNIETKTISDICHKCNGNEAEFHHVMANQKILPHQIYL